MGVLHSCLHLIMHKADTMSLKHRNLLHAEHDPEVRRKLAPAYRCS